MRPRTFPTSFPQERTIMNEANAQGAAAGSPHADPGPCIPARAARAPAGDGDGQELRRLFLDPRGRIRDAHAGEHPPRAAHRLSLAVDAEAYRAFQARCREHDLSVAMALQLLMSGRELPAPRPMVLELPAVVDAEALHVLHHLEDRIAACQAGGVLDGAAAGRIHALLAGISEAVGGTPCPCAGRRRSGGAGSARREDG
jgi:hypothetical protein